MGVAVIVGAADVSHVGLIITSLRINCRQIGTVGGEEDHIRQIKVGDMIDDLCVCDVEQRSIRFDIETIGVIALRADMIFDDPLQ